MAGSIYRDQLWIPFEEIELATNNFADENLIARRHFETAYTLNFTGNVYRGQLLQSEQMIDILVSMYFLSELCTVPCKEMKLCLLEHENIKSILHCSELNRSTLFLVDKVEANGSLAKHLPADSTLTWKQRLSICIGVAQALKYVHNPGVVEPGHYLIHGNIKSSKILLDENWQPKLQGFIFAMVAKRNTLYVTSKYKGTLQYKDPAYENTGGLTDKSDVFSFGVVLFEVLFGRKAASSTPNEVQVDDWNFAKFARSHCQNKTLDKMIDPDLRKTMDPKSVKKFSDVAYQCLKERREERPNMDQVVKALEQSLKLQKNHEQHSLVLVKQTSSSDYLQGKSFEHLKIPLKDIISATENFNVKYQIGSGGYGMVYKAKLEHFGGDMRKICSTVAIKRIFSREDGSGAQGFIAEVKMLSNCKHPNIVSLLGFCDDGDQKILVYEHVSNGSLDEYLENSYRMTTLTWSSRLQICLDIAKGLNYLHSGLKDNERIIHRDIKSANILLDNNLRAKIADFGLSRLHTIDPNISIVKTGTLAGTNFYLDPEYENTGNLGRASDIYSFGVVLFEILCGTLAYDQIYTAKSEKGLPYVARRLFNEGTIKTMVDRSIKETGVSAFSQNRRADEHSLDIVLNIANQCLAETQAARPKIEDVIKQLENALNFQRNNKDNLEFLLEDIKLVTQNFSDCNCIGKGRSWKLYKGEVPKAISNAKGCTAIIAKRWSKSDQGHEHFSKELFLKEVEFVFRHKHENVVDLVGYCTEMEEKIILYDHSSKASLDKHLKDVSLTWIERLKICIDVASGLEFLHSGGGPEETVMMHGDIKSGSILIDGNGNAKVSNLQLNSTNTFYQASESLEDADEHFLGPSIVERGTLSKESDIYSLGVLLVEVLSGRLAWEEGRKDPPQSLGPLAIRWYRERQELDEMVFEGIKDQIDPFSFDVFTSITYSCFMTTQPNASDVLKRLEEALKETLEFQKNLKASPQRSLEDIKQGTQNFSDDKCVGKGKYWKIYEREFPDDTTALVKRWDNKSPEARHQFLTELGILSKYKNNDVIVGIEGYCKEMDEKIIVYERGYNRSLDKHLDDASLSWINRLKICINVASVVDSLDRDDVGFRGIKSGSILIDGDWKGKVSNLELAFKDSRYHYNFALNDTLNELTVVLLEILCGRLNQGEGCESFSESLKYLAERHYKEKGNLDELVFEGIKEEIAPESLTKFIWTVSKFMEFGGRGRLNRSRVVVLLKEALTEQEYFEASPQLSLEDIKQGTQNFSDDKCVDKGKYWKIYEGEFPDDTTALVKRWDNKSPEAHHQFFTELRILSKYKNNDIIVGIEGHCREMDEKIIVYERGYNRSLDKHLDDASLSWINRLKICINVVSIVDSLYRDGVTPIYIKSGSILIDSDWRGKVSNLELTESTQSWIALSNIINKLGVVLLEILSGRLDWGEGSESYSESLKSLADRHYKEKGNLDEWVFEGIKEKIAPESLTIFVREYERFGRRVRKKTNTELLEKALEEHKYIEESPQISLEDIKSATHNFSDEKCIGEGRYWKLYEGEFPLANASGYTSTTLVKRWDSKSSRGRTQFFRELGIHFRCRKNENIVAVKGYCSEKDEKIIVFEHALNRSLDKHLDDTSLSWMKRLNICINVASVLDLFHNTDPTGPPSMIHGDIRSGSILIDGDWNAKVSNFFEVFARDGEWESSDNKAHSSLGYVDPQHQGLSGMYKDIYAFGVVLLEMLCGRLAWGEGCEDHSQSLGPLAKRHYKEKGNLNELVFEGIKEQITPESLIAYQAIALKCIQDISDYQPDGQAMVKQLQNALKLQEYYETWNCKLPIEYKEYIKMSKTPEIYSTEVKKDLHDMLTKGMLLQQDQLWFTLGANGERNEMISAIKFAYKNRLLRIWQSIPESRFQKVAQMLDISNLKIQIRIKTQFLSPGINYGVYLVFKFCGSRKSRADREYVNLSYKRGKDNLHAYFATWRDDEWMMIELCRFSNDKKDVDFEAILKSFSRCYCGSRIIYVEGIEFRSIDNVNYEEIEKSKDVQQVLKSCSNIDEVQQSTIECQEISKISGEKNQVNGKKQLRLSTMEFLYDCSNVKPFDLNLSSVSRSQEVEFLSQQVFGIKCKIESGMLSPATDYMCYLVFKFSEKCDGLHGPVIIRDLLNWKSKETGILYFRSQSPWNLHDTDWVPRERKDGLMEVTVWKFNSKSELRNDSIPMNLKLITYDGTMSGLIVCSLQIRPI